MPRQLVVKVTAPPQGGRANEALISVLSESLGIAKSQIVLQRGQRSRNKLVLLGMDVLAYQNWVETVPIIGKE